MEACTEKALLAYDHDTGHKVLEWSERFDGLPNGYADQFIVVANKEFVAHSSVGRERFKNLPNILLMLHSMSPQYKEFEHDIKKRGTEIPYPYKELQLEVAFPEFSW